MKLGKISKVNYYAKIKYRNKEKDYRVVAEQDNDLQIEYLDSFLIERYSDRIWIKNGKDKIIKKYTFNDKEYKYYKILFKEMIRNFDYIKKQMISIFGTNKIWLHHRYYEFAFKKAINKTNQITNFNIFPSKKIPDNIIIIEKPDK